MTVRIFRGDAAVAALPAGDRGLAYGDGLFETMRVQRGEVHWWDAHWRRLGEGARRLGIELPAEAHVRDEMRSLFDDSHGVAKLLLTRGSGGRGYAPPVNAEPTWLLSRHALPPALPPGLTVRWCELTLASQPALAGMKHCNRLEQVLARAEWRDPGVHEGLMRDAEGHVVCATSANVFALVGGEWVTPPVDRAGVAGVCRGWVLGNGPARIGPLKAADVDAAEAVFLCNAVRGILPIARLGEREWAPHAAVADLQRRLAAAHPAFAPECS